MRLPAIAALPLLSGCVQLVWRRDTRFEAPPPAALAELEPGRATLAECLDRLGAPLFVWEYKGDGAALAWGWSVLDDRYISIGLPIQDNYTASFSYDESDVDLPGVVLFFDREWKLEMVKEGRLRNLREKLVRRRPAPAADGDSG